MGINKNGASDTVVVIAALLVPVRPARNKGLPGPQFHRFITTIGSARKPGWRRHDHV